jgi:hypothetical protein
MHFNPALADESPLGNVAISQPLRHQGGDFSLAGGERVRVFRAHRYSPEEIDRARSTSASKHRVYFNGVDEKPTRRMAAPYFKNPALAPAKLTRLSDYSADVSDSMQGQHSEGWVTMDARGRAQDYIAMLDGRNNLQGIEQATQTRLRQLGTSLSSRGRRRCRSVAPLVWPRHRKPAPATPAVVGCPPSPRLSAARQARGCRLLPATPAVVGCRPRPRLSAARHATSGDRSLSPAAPSAVMATSAFKMRG